jgi:hypothetical protein
MRPVVLFIDDAAASQATLRPLVRAVEPGRVILIACPPALTRRVGRFVSDVGREHHRQRWARELFADLQSVWAAATGITVETLVAKAPIEVMVQRLRVHCGTDLVGVDARRTRLGQAHEVSAPTRAQALARWLVPALVSSGVGIALALAE